MTPIHLERIAKLHEQLARAYKDAARAGDAEPVPESVLALTGEPAPAEEPKRLPTNPIAIRLGAIMHRMASTEWTAREIASFRKNCANVTEEELSALEAYYKKNWPPRSDANILRHSLEQLLNNIRGEIDRAKMSINKTPSRRHEWTPTKPDVAPPSPEEAERIAAAAKEEARKFRERMQ